MTRTNTATAIEQARLDVLAADGGCVAWVVDPHPGTCRDRWGRPIEGRATSFLELDRVRDAPSMGQAPSHEDRTRMVALCPGHHRGTGAQGGYQWATAHRDDLRAYLAQRNARLGWTS